MGRVITDVDVYILQLEKCVSELDKELDKENRNNDYLDILEEEIKDLRTAVEIKLVISSEQEEKYRRVISRYENVRKS